jgi:hypothetical protein
MTREMADILTAGLGIAEIAAYSLAGLGVLRHWGFTLAEAAAGAALLPAMLVSFLLQAAHLSGFAILVPVMRLSVLAMALGVIWRYRQSLHAVGRSLGLFSRDHPLAVGVLGMSLVSLVVTAVMIGWYGGDFTGPYPWAPLASPDRRTLLMQTMRGGSYFPGAVLLPWTAYLAVCLATYALARRYAWPPTAITVTLLVASMPRLVFLSVSCCLEVVLTAAALLSILLLYRAVERPEIRNLLLFFVVLAFGISGDGMGLVFPLVGLGLAVTILYRRHGGRIWWDLLRSAPLSAVTAGVVAFVYAYGGYGHGRFLMATFPAAAWSYNADGLMGATANFFRYGLQIIDLTPPVDFALLHIAGLNWFGARLWIHEHLVAAVFQSKGLASAFVPNVPGDMELAWFGPFAGLLFPAALGWALMRGPRRLKSLALALMVYFFLAVLIPAWMPGNVRYFTLFFVCAGFTAAFLLPPWRMTRRRLYFFQVSALALMVYAVGRVFHSL